MSRMFYFSGVCLTEHRHSIAISVTGMYLKLEIRGFCLNASSFNGDVSRWNVSNVTRMNAMLEPLHSMAMLVTGMYQYG